MNSIIMKLPEGRECSGGRGVSLTGISYIQASQEPDWKFSMHSHLHEMELSVILSGEAWIYMKNRSYRAKAGDIVIKNAGELHSEKSEPSNPVEQICLCFSGLTAGEEGSGDSLVNLSSPVVRIPEEYEALFPMSRLILNLCLNRRTGTSRQKSARALDSTLVSFLDILQLNLDGGRAEEPPLGNMELVEGVIRYLNNNYYQKISLRDLSARFFISPYYLERKFRETTGYTIGQYVTGRRMGEAQRLLAFENLSIKEVAAKCGYERIQYFYTVFKKNAGITPDEFRRKYSAD